MGDDGFPETLPAKGGAGARDKTGWSPGSVIGGRYHIVRPLGSGGMGDVFETEDRLLGERVALKALRAGVAGDQAMERFKREIVLAHKVTHRNVCRVFEVGVHEGTAFLTMELVEGETLATRVRARGALGVDEAWPIVRQICAGLGAAHEAGVIHRDLKPENVLLRDGRAVITDFGIARLAGDDRVKLEQMTGTGDVLGTPAYMAPEQLLGQPVTPAVDIYALGMLLYHLVTGKLPFSGDSAMAAAMRRLHEAPPSPRALVPDLDARWETAILRCLARDPRARFASVDEVAAALAPAPPRKPAVPRAALAVAAVALVALGVTVGILGRRREAPRLPEVAVLGFRNVTGAADRAWLSTALAEGLAAELRVGGRVRTVAGEKIAEVRRSLGLADVDSFAPSTLARIRASLGADYVVVGSYTAVGDKLGVVITLQDTARGEMLATAREEATETALFDIVSRAAVPLRQAFGGGALTTEQTARIAATRPASPQAARLYSEGLDALRTFEWRKARDVLARAVTADPGFALAHLALGQALDELGAEKEANESYARALAASADLPRPDRLWVEGIATRDNAAAAARLGELFELDPGDLEHGLRYATRLTTLKDGSAAYPVLERLRKLPAPLSGDPRIDLVEALAAARAKDGARELAAARRAAARAESLGLHGYLAAARWHEAETLIGTGRREQGMRALEDALALEDEQGNRKAVSRLRMTRGQELANQGDVGAGIAELESALAIADEIGAVSLQGTNHQLLSNVLANAGREVEARRHGERALELLRQAGDLHNVPWEMQSLGWIARAEGDLAAAEARCREALQAAAAVQHDHDARGAHQCLAQLALDRGDAAGARAELAILERIQRAESDLEPELDSDLPTQILLAEGKLAEAEIQARRRVESTRGEGSLQDEIEARTALVMVLVAGAKGEEARRQASQLRSRLPSTAVGLPQLFALVADAAARLVGADAAAAAALASELAPAIDRLAAEGLPPALLIEVRLQLGKAELAAGRVEKGRARLEEVERDAREHGMLQVAGDAAKALGQ